MTSKTDRELLELAAKAIGKEIWTDIDENYYCFDLIGEEAAWNPLADDVAALRLAVVLELDIMFLNGDTLVLNICEGGGDPFERTRRAIVRAAAAIGEKMP